MQRIMFNLRVSKVIYVVIVLSNLVLPWGNGDILQMNLFHLIAIALWTYALFSHLGYFLKQVRKNGNTVEYECSIPIVRIGLTRILEATWLFFFVDKVNWVIFLVLVILDVIYTAFIMLDKSNYYYESEDAENGSN